MLLSTVKVAEFEINVTAPPVELILTRYLNPFDEVVKAVSASDALLAPEILDHVVPVAV